MPKGLSFGILPGCWMALCLFHSVLALGQIPSDSWFARAWGTEDGLPDNAVHSLAQTADGYIWCTTDGGLARFDGASFRKFPLSNIVSNNPVPAKLFVDSRARFWIVMNRGAILSLETNASRLFSVKEGLPEAYPTKLAEDGEGSLWIAYAGAKAYRIQDGRVSSYGPEQGLPGGSGTWEVTTDVYGQVWFARGRRVGVFRGEQFRTVATTRATAIRITGATGGGVWFTAGTDIYRLKDGMEPEKVGETPSGSVIMTLFEDRDRTLWVGTEVHGLYRLNGTQLEYVRTSHRGISRMLQDREGNLWVGTLGGGLNRLRPRVVELIDADAGLPVESLRSVCKETNGTLWAVTRNARVIRREGETWIDASARPDWPGGNAYCIAADPGGGVWIGTWGRGLYRWRNGAYTRIAARESGLAADFVRALMFSSNGDLWIGQDATASGQATLQRKRGNEWRTFDLPDSPRLLRAFAEDTSGSIWGGCGNGRLYRITGDEVFNETARSRTNQPVGIRSIAATKDGSVWVGYPGSGLGWIKDGRYARITSKQGLSDDYISQIMDDGHGWLWFCGGSTVFKVEWRELLEVAEGRRGHIRSIVYGRGEGISGLQAAFECHPVTLRDSDERLYVATRMGLGVIHTRRLKDNPEPPLVLIDRVSTNGHAMAAYDSLAMLPAARMNELIDLRRPGAKMALRPDHKRVEIGFTALSFTAPENVHFRYRLAGVDDDWVEAGSQRTASYPQLAAGTYRFDVIACNNSGLWNEKGASLSFTVMPFFWQTWWFRFGAAAVFTLSIVAMVRYVFLRRLRRQLRLLEHQAALHKERARIAKDIHDDLGGNLTQITLLGDLAHQDIAIPEKADAHVQKISKTAREVVKSLDEIVWAVNPRNDTLSHLIDYIGQFTADYLRVPGLRCRLDLPENPPDRNIPADVRHNLFLVVKEALNNVVKHAHATEVWLRVNVANGKLRVVIEDNGRGFDRAPQDSVSDGLRNMRHRLSDIGGECTIESSRGAGTKVTLELPWDR